MPTEHKCEHEICACSVPDSQQFCSEVCKGSHAGEEMCGCMHHACAIEGGYGTATISASTLERIT